MAQKVEKEPRPSKRQLMTDQNNTLVDIRAYLAAIRIMIDSAAAEDGPLNKLLRAVRAIELETAHPPRAMTPATDRELTRGSFDLAATRELCAGLDAILRGGDDPSHVYTLNASEATIVLYALRHMVFSTGES